jgi:hypothetical protein
MAWAQPAAKDDPALETVIVTAPKLHFGVTPNAIAHDFVSSFATPTVLRDAIARWQVGICPEFLGVAPNFAQLMEGGLRTIAGRAGASMKEKGCRPNLSVIFTAQPQAYLDALDAKNVDALGYKGATTVTHPIQAWYVTGITDLDGITMPDHEVFSGFSTSCTNTALSCWTLSVSKIGGWRDHPDLSSDLLYVTIIVDSTQTGKFTVASVADYIAMLALSRTEDYDDCQLMPSITNLLSSNCDENLKPAHITPTDIAYLRGVYKMDAGATLQIQQDQIAGEMAVSLGGHEPH